MTDLTNPREQLSQAMIDSASNLRGGVYHVRRGTLPWGAETWEGKDFACGILIRESEPFRRDGERRATVLAYFLGKSDGANRREVELELSDLIASDAGEFLVALGQARIGKDLVCVVDMQSAGVDDLADADFRVQGVIVTFNVLF